MRNSSDCGKEIRIVASPEAAATIASARYLLEKGKVLSKPAALDRIIADWKRLRKAEEERKRQEPVAPRTTPAPSPRS